MPSHKGCATILVFGLSLLGLAPVAYGHHCGLQSPQACNNAPLMGGHWCEWKPTPGTCGRVGGMTYQEIIALQKKLNETEHAKLRVNGVLDKSTVKAIKKFQLDSGIEPTGKPNPQTIERLKP